MHCLAFIKVHIATSCSSENRSITKQALFQEKNRILWIDTPYEHADKKLHSISLELANTDRDSHISNFSGQGRTDKSKLAIYKPFIKLVETSGKIISSKWRGIINQVRAILHTTWWCEAMDFRLSLKAIICESAREFELSSNSSWVLRIRWTLPRRGYAHFSE